MLRGSMPEPKTFTVAFQPGAIVAIKESDLTATVIQVLVEGQPMAVQYKVSYFFGGDQKCIWLADFQVEPTQDISPLEFGFHKL